MKKFPVTSVSGIEYMAKVYRGKYTEMRVSLYVNKQTVFGFNRFKRVSDTGLLFATTNFADSDYVGMIKYAVAIHERAEDARKQRKLLDNRNMSKFEEWDGNCSDK